MGATKCCMGYPVTQHFVAIYILHSLSFYIFLPYLTYYIIKINHLIPCKYPHNLISLCNIISYRLLTSLYYSLTQWSFYLLLKTLGKGIMYLLTYLQLYIT